MLLPIFILAGSGDICVLWTHSYIFYISLEYSSTTESIF